MNVTSLQKDAAAFPSKDSAARKSSSNVNDRLRAARTALAERLDSGFSVDDLMREGAAAMVELCVAAFDDRGDVSGGWLVAAVRAGGAWTSVRHGGETAAANVPFSEYDQAVGL
jgi:hypothetical protein